MEQWFECFHSVTGTLINPISERLVFWYSTFFTFLTFFFSFFFLILKDTIFAFLSLWGFLTKKENCSVTAGRIFPDLGGIHSGSLIQMIAASSYHSAHCCGYLVTIKTGVLMTAESTSKETSGGSGYSSTGAGSPGCKSAEHLQG